MNGWEDRGIYWACRRHDAASLPPTEKRINYAEISDGDSKMNLAVTIFENGITKEVNRGELAWHQRHGSKITMPGDCL